ncbi:MAG TPA: hypothetical protein VFQ55_13415, partial [Casimicrobiaceae bacterium]|nr:hypothetical protein [Casimicrobiaceae bacterium]
MARNPQGHPYRTLALPPPRHAVPTPARSSALRIACWVAGVALWLGLAFAAGAEPSMGMASASAPSRAPSALLRRLKPSAPVPAQAALARVVVAAPLRPKATDVATVYRFFNRWTGVHFYTADEAERAHIVATWPQFADEGAAWRALR